jgi:hypothetical protein
MTLQGILQNQDCFFSFSYVHLKKHSKMHGLIKTTNFSNSWEESMPVLEYVYGIINSKIDFIELKTRKLLDKYRTKDATTGHHKSDTYQFIPSMSDLSVHTSDTEQIFKYLETLSRSIYLLEQIKLALSDYNAYSVVELLNDDKYLTVNELEIANLSKYRLAA